MGRLAEINARLAEIRSLLDDENADVDKLSEEVDALIAERDRLMAQAQSRQTLIAKIASGELGDPAGGDDPDSADGEGEPVMNRAMRRMPPGRSLIDMKDREKRAKAFLERRSTVISGAECRALLLSTGNIATPTKVSGINDLPGVVSSIVDLVFVEDCTGMSADKVAYQVTESTAAAVTEGQAPSTSEPTFNYVEISSTKYGLMAYVSEEIVNQTPLAYEEKVLAAVRKALRKKAVDVIVGAVEDSALADEITMTTIGAGTLRTIAMSYSADSVVDQNAWLFLNKADLIAFGDVRGTNEKKAVYEITPDPANPNTGVIKDGGLSVKYCIVPQCTALTGTTNSSTTATKPTMFYGQPMNIKMDLFGSMKVSVSEDYKFAEGLLAVRGTASFGVKLVVPKGMLRVAIPKAS